MRARCHGQCEIYASKYKSLHNTEMAIYKNVIAQLVTGAGFCRRAVGRFLPAPVNGSIAHWRAASAAFDDLNPRPLIARYRYLLNLRARSDLRAVDRVSIGAESLRHPIKSARLPVRVSNCPRMTVIVSPLMHGIGCNLRPRLCGQNYNRRDGRAFSFQR
ncbi:hypothetical protein EVAR_21984_1 [Eumeta japonica]|uniref:Uncharacterized protein n=1 Tax=Eumeta variegata TaxID=151549 RepID=A0A4C1VUA7_EUMVA|nr:hypothetical protein EVAR_21984_1 [Eumeta japonica]